ncbi:MAG: hypothetical protein P9L94_02395 [Candidatus Hinthialibacter antarcticus]|nr:hypothetical protein [Candidatus Hinthialibacter antarcticus]
MSNKLRSSQLLSQLYWRYQRRRLIGLLSLCLLCLMLGAQGMLFTGMALRLEQFSLNVLFTVLLLGGAAVIGRYIYDWLADGVFARRFFHQWESHHQDVAHRTDLVVYSERQPDEIQRLGYSQELIHAEDEILIERLQAIAQHSAPTPLRLPLALLAAVVISSGLMWLVKGDALQAESRRIAQALVVYDAPDDSLSLQVPTQVTVKRGDPLTLSATIQGDPKGQFATLHREFRSGWESVSVAPQDGRAEFSLPSLNREMVYYISLGDALSNRGTATPLDPPALAKGRIVIQPPAYTNLPQETINHWRAFSAPRGSHVTFAGIASASLTAATAQWLGNPYPLTLGGGEFAIEIEQIHQNSEFTVSMQDENGMIGQSQSIQIEMVEDATPQVEIMAPPENIDIPGGMAIGVSAHIQDDYGARIMLLHSQLNYDESTNKSELVWKYTEEQAADINSGKDFYVNFEWNIAPFEMYPGDELTFYLEAFDEDPFHGPKAARSKTHTVRYPSLLDLVDELNQEEDTHIEDLNEILAEQRDIRNNLDDTLERIAEKSEMQGQEEQGEEQFWMEKQELETIKDRQEELIEEAKRIEEELEQYQESANEELSSEEKEEQGFTPDTLEKLSRVQELMKEMVDQESQQLMEQMESAIEQLSQNMDAEQMQELDFSVQNFEEQLDRTLSMLESTFQFRQLEGLRQTAEELAQRQDHLMRETEQLQQDVSSLESEIQEMEEQAQQLAQEQEQQGENSQAENSQSGEQNQGEQTPSGENSESSEQSEGEQGDAASEEQQRLQEEINKKKEELSAKENLLAQRQERLQEDAEAMMEQMEKMKEEMSESNPMLAQKMEQMLEQLQENKTMQQMKKAAQQLQSGQPQMAQQNQKKALESLQQMSEQMNDQMANMGMQNMEEDSNQIKRLVDRGLFLSDEMEGLTESVMGQSEALAALRIANAYLREIKRVRTVWKGVAAQNPYLNRRSGQLLQQSEQRLYEAVEVGQGVKWLGLHEARQSLIALNQALRQMMQDNQDMMQQMQQQQSSMQDFQQQMQQMMQQQQSLNQMMQQLKQQGEQGEKMAEQLKRMAQQQSRIRKEIEKMMQQNRHARQLKNRLQGIYDEMREVEKLLEAGESGDEVDERQQRIMTRMLEAGTMQEEDEYGRERREETPDAVETESPEGEVKTDWKDSIRRSLEQPPLDNIPPQYREAIKKHYIRLSEEALPG